MFGIFRPIMKHYFYWNHNKLYREAMVNNRTVELTATGFCRRMWEWWRNESGSASWRIVFLKNGEQPDFFISSIKDFVFSVRLLTELCKNVTWLAVHRQNPLHFRGSTLLLIFVNTATLAFGLNGRDAMHFKIQYIIIEIVTKHCQKSNHNDLTSQSTFTAASYPLRLPTHAVA